MVHLTPTASRMTESAKMCCTMSKCCFCIGLRAGVITVACMLLVWDAFLLIVTSLLAAYDSYADQEYIREAPEMKDGGEAALKVAGVFLTMMISTALLALAVLLDIMLIAAAIRIRQKLLRAWMVTYAMVCFLSLLTFRLNMKVFFIDYTGILFILGHTGLVLYLWIVVRSYYLQLTQKCDDDEHRSMLSKVNWMVLPVDSLRAQETICDKPGKGVAVTTPPHYNSAEKPVLCHPHNEVTSPGGVC